MPRKMQIMGKFPSGSGGDGLSAYEIAKKNGFEGSETEWLESLKGDPGPTGEKGEKGDSGVYVGSEEPESNATVWIDPNGENANAYINGLIDTKLGVIENGTY